MSRFYNSDWLELYNACRDWLTPLNGSVKGKTSCRSLGSKEAMIDKGRVHWGLKEALPTEKSDCASDFCTQGEFYFTIYFPEYHTRWITFLFLACWVCRTGMVYFKHALLLICALTTKHQPVQPHYSAVNHWADLLPKLEVKKQIVFNFQDFDFRYTTAHDELFSLKCCAS